MARLSNRSAHGRALKMNDRDQHRPASFVCVGLNPAIDKRLRLDRLQPGCVNRASQAIATPGGKAAHVAMVLRALGADPVWLGFAGGSNGTALLEGLYSLSIRTRSVSTAASTRVNLEILENEGEVTEILEPGFPVTVSETEELRRQYESLLKASEGKATVILSGSLPQGLPQDFYATLVKTGRQYGCRFFLDTSGMPLRLGLKGRPDFVKPNQEEAESLTGTTIEGLDSARVALEKTLREGAGSAAVTLGDNGLVWRDAKRPETLFARIPKIAGASTVGSGDATVAGFAFAAQLRLEPVDAVRLAVACGAANCLADLPGRVRLADVERLRSQVQVETLQSREETNTLPC